MPKKRLKWTTATTEYQNKTGFKSFQLNEFLQQSNRQYVGLLKIFFIYQKIISFMRYMGWHRKKIPGSLLLFCCCCCCLSGEIRCCFFLLILIKIGFYKKKNNTIWCSGCCCGRIGSDRSVDVILQLMKNNQKKKKEKQLSP